MKKVFAALAALAMMAAVVSCEYDSPDIRFQGSGVKVCV